MNKIKCSLYTLFGWSLSLVFVIVFCLTLLVFHLLQLFALLFGKRTHRVVLDLMNALILTELRILGTRYQVTFDAPLPNNRNIIFVSNHQSMFDIALIIWHLRLHAPRFIAKKELAHWIPSISLALRTMGSVWIDRSDAKGALTVIRNFAIQTRLQATSNNYTSICIFPEGTRARDGIIKRFKVRGVLALLEELPDAAIVPLAISNSWRIVEHKLLPIPFGIQVKLRVFAPLSATEMSQEGLVSKIEDQITQEVSDKY